MSVGEESPRDDNPPGLAQSRCTETLTPSLGFCSSSPLSLEAQFKSNFSESWLGRAQHRDPHPAITCPPRRIAADLTCAGASQVLPFFLATEVRAPGLHRALHRQQAALSKGTDTQSHGHTAGRRGHRAASGSEVRGAARGEPHRRHRPPLHLLFLQARSRPSPSPFSSSATPMLSGAPRQGSGDRGTEGSGVQVSRSTGRGLGPRRPGGRRRGRGREAEERGRTEPL